MAGRTSTRMVAWVLAIIASSAGPARAESVAVVPLASTGELSPDDVLEVSRAVAAVLRENHFEVFEPASAAQAVDGRVPGCVASRRISCLAEALQALGWPRFVSGRVTRAGAGPEVTVSLEIYESRTGRVAVDRSLSGDGSGRAALVALGRAVCAALADELAAARRPARLSVESVPADAVVRWNGRVLGRTPLGAELPPGRGLLRVESPGRAAEIREVVLAPAQSSTVSVVLRDLGAAPATRASWQLPAGLVIGGVGLAIAVYGMVGLLRSDCMDEYADGACYRQLSSGDRVAYGVVPLGLGAVVGMAGALTAFVLRLGTPETP
jgi:PEGA domain-containing protein